MAQPLSLHDDTAGNVPRLLAQAEAFDNRAAKLREEAAELARMAADLRVDVDRMTRAPLAIITPEPDRPEREDTAFLDRIMDALADAGPLSIADLSEHLGATVPRTRKGVLRLVAIGSVTRTGIKSGTRYELADAREDDDDAGASVHAFHSYETTVRDAAVGLGTFDMVDMQRVLSDVAEGTLRRWIRRLEDRGVLKAERVDGRNVYTYVPAEGGPTHRPRHEAPEARALREAGPERRRGAPVAGTGKGTRTGVAIVDELIREVRKLDPTITTKRTAHKLAFMRGPWEIAHTSTTPGASSLKESRRQLQRAGVPVKS